MGRGLGVVAIALAVASIAAAAPTAVVTITDASLAPALVGVDAGGSVTWRNAGARSHRVVSGDRAFAAFTLAPGAERTVSFTSNGRHPYTVDGTRCGIVFVGVPVVGGCTGGGGRVSGGRVSPPRVGTKIYTYDVELRMSVKNDGLLVYEGHTDTDWTRTIQWSGTFRNVKFKVITVGRNAIGVHSIAPRFLTATVPVRETWDYFWHPHKAFPPTADCDGQASGGARARLAIAVSTYGAPNYYVKAQILDWNRAEEMEADCDGWAPRGIVAPEFRLSEGTEVSPFIPTLAVDFERRRGGLRAPAGQLASGGGFTIDTGIRTMVQNHCEGSSIPCSGELTIEQRYVAIFKPRRR